MAETPDKRQIYYIPENYISESRIHLGQSSLRIRYLVDSAALSFVLGLFAALFTEGVHKRGLTLERLAQITSENAARIMGL